MAPNSINFDDDYAPGAYRRPGMKKTGARTRARRLRRACFARPALPKVLLWRGPPDEAGRLSRDPAYSDRLLTFRSSR